MYSLILSLIVNIIYMKFITKNPVNLFGFGILKVITGSMAPTIQSGETIIIKKSKKYEVGDIITYKSSDGSIITHRIISIDNDLYYTKGDFNNVEDNEPIKIEQIYGKVIFHFYSFMPNSIFSLAQYKSSNTKRGGLKIAKPVFIVEGENEIFINKYGSINDYDFSVKNYTSNNRSEVSLKYKIAVKADEKIKYKLFCNNQEIDINKIFELSNTTKEKYDYILRIEAPEDYEGKVRVNIYAYQKEV